MDDVDTEHHGAGSHGRTAGAFDPQHAESSKETSDLTWSEEWTPMLLSAAETG